jgi:hypothetical protein
MVPSSRKWMTPAWLALIFGATEAGHETVHSR